MSDDKKEDTGIGLLSIASIALGFATMPLIFCCVGYGTGLLGVVLGVLGFVAKNSTGNRVAAGMGVGINILAMGGYSVLLMIGVVTDDGSRTTTATPATPSAVEQGGEANAVAPTEGEAPAPQPAAVPVPTRPQMPDSQKAFCDAIDAARTAYDAAEGDLKKSKERSNRAAALKAAVPTRKAKDWIGNVYKLTTTGEGKAVFTLELPCTAWVGTTNNALSDTLNPMPTLIAQSSPLYDAIATYEQASWSAKGTAIMFSGSFASDDKNGLSEVSLIELSSMTKPEFLFQFTKVGPP